MANGRPSASQITHNLKVFGNGSMQKGLERLAAESKRAGILEERARNVSWVSKLFNNLMRTNR